MKRQLGLGVILMILNHYASAGNMGDSKPWHGVYF
jgi:hypothetical protein